MKINFVPVIKFLETASIFKIFTRAILIPTFFGCVVQYFMQHKGTRNLVTSEVEWQISVGGQVKGNVVIGLFGDDVPKTVKNFETFASKGFQGYKYEGTTFHRVKKQYMVQGGDVLKGSDHPKGQVGEGRLSIFGLTFPDETFDVKHAGPGFVGMANMGPDTNACQFYIALTAANYMDDSHVVFGKVTEGLDLIQELSLAEVDEKLKPLQDITISQSTARKVTNTYFISNDPYNIYDYVVTMLKPIVPMTFICSCFTYLMNYVDRGIQLEDAQKKLLKKALAREEKEAAAAADGGGARKRKTNESKTD